jgi:hypothetical protein
VFSPLLGTTNDAVHLSFETVQNIVTQKLAVALAQKSAPCLLEAQEAAKGKISTNAVVYLKYKEDESFWLKLEILKVADAMMDKSFNSDEKSKAGLSGSIPWPPDKDRPEALKGKPLWWPRQSPEDFKESDPALYVFYKPLYEKNLQDNREQQGQKHIKRIRSELLREIRDTLGRNSAEKKEASRTSRFKDMVKEHIQDIDLAREILSGTAFSEEMEKK